MGDVRYEEVYDRVAQAEDRTRLLATMRDEEVIAALAAASAHQDALLSNVLATEAHNRTARLSRLLSAMGEAVLVVKFPQLEIQSVNRSAERMFGYSEDELRGKSPAILHVDERHFQAFQDRVREAIRAGRTLQTEYQMRRRDGGRFPTEHTVAPIPDRDGHTVGALSLVRDVSARRRAERRLATQNAVTRVLAGASGFDAAVTAVLEAFCQNLDWELGEAWWVHPRRDVMLLEQVWEAEPAETGGFVSDSRKLTFVRGEGLPGRIWESGQATGFLDVGREAAFVRRAAARRLGFRAGFGLPVQAGARMIGVLTFLSRHPHEFDEELRQVMDGVGRQLGLYVVRFEAEELARRLVEASPDATVVTDVDGRIVFWNGRAVKLLGQPHESLLGQPIDRILAPSSAEAFHEQRRATGHGEAPPERPAEYALLRADGTEFVAEITFSPFRTRAGRMVASAIRDSTARHAEEATAGELAAIVRSSSEAVISVDRRGIIVTWNPAATRIYGYSEAEALGRPIGLIVPEDRAGELAEIGSRVRAGASVPEVQTERLARDGRRVRVSVSFSPVRDRRGNVVGIASIARPV